jgi:hypothetical protein
MGSQEEYKSLGVKSSQSGAHGQRLAEHATRHGVTLGHGTIDPLQM